MQQSLQRERFVVEIALNYTQALEKIHRYNYNCILLDITLLDDDGLQLLRVLKRLHKRESVIITSAKDSLSDKIAGLDLGVDDCLPKPFHLTGLNARIKSVIRRGQNNGEQEIRIENLTLEPEHYAAYSEKYSARKPNSYLRISETQRDHAPLRTPERRNL